MNRPRTVVTLAATDPANPYGAMLPWPPLPEGTGHRPGRKAGALVVLADGALVFYVERGGKTVLAFGPAGGTAPDDAAAGRKPPLDAAETDEVLRAAAESLAEVVTAGRVEKLAVQTVNGQFVVGTAVGDALRAAGFGVSPQGLRLRA